MIMYASDLSWKGISAWRGEKRLLGGCGEERYETTITLLFGVSSSWLMHFPTGSLPISNYVNSVSRVQVTLNFWLNVNRKMINFPAIDSNILSPLQLSKYIPSGTAQISSF